MHTHIARQLPIGYAAFFMPMIRHLSTLLGGIATLAHIPMLTTSSGLIPAPARRAGSASSNGARHVAPVRRRRCNVSYKITENIRHKDLVLVSRLVYDAHINRAL